MVTAGISVRDQPKKVWPKHYSARSLHPLFAQPESASYTFNRPRNTFEETVSLLNEQFNLFSWWLNGAAFSQRCRNGNGTLTLLLSRIKIISRFWHYKILMDDNRFYCLLSSRVPLSGTGKERPTLVGVPVECRRVTLPSVRSACRV